MRIDLEDGYGDKITVQYSEYSGWVHIRVGDDEDSAVYINISDKEDLIAFRTVLDIAIGDRGES